jgi:hypothetical protein
MRTWRIPTKIAALLAALRPEGFDGLKPVERRRFADIPRHWVRIAESSKRRRKRGSEDSKVS